MMKIIFQIALLLSVQCIYAQTPSNQHVPGDGKVISLGSSSVTIPAEWMHQVEVGSNNMAVTTIYHPGKPGSLKFKSLVLPKIVTQEVLRNMTNVSTSITLSWQQWGDFGGYQYDYTEGGKFYRQWWLTNQDEILLFVYSNDQQNESDREVINNIILSITANNQGQ
jgi:hypothetical protein